MKKKMYLSIMTFFALIASAMATESQQEPGPIALSIVLDTAWSNEQEIADYKSLSRQVIASRRPGDYLEIITGHPGKPRLRVAQFIRSGNSQELKNITALLQGVNCPIFSDVNISKAVDMALKRLAKSSEKNTFAHTAMIVFTDGKLSDSDVTQFQQLANEFKKRNWSLWITGTYATNKKLLVAANQGKFEFSLISEANPVLWIQSKRDITITKSTRTEIPLNEDSSPTKDSGKTEYSVTIDSNISFLEGMKKDSGTPSAEFPGDLRQEPQESITPFFEAETEKLVVDAIEPEFPAEEPQEEAVAEPTESKEPQKLNKNFLWLVPAVGLLTVLALLFLNSISKARKWKSGITSRLNTTQQKDPGTLIVKMNGQTHSLGRPDRIKAINIGSDSQNTIKIPGKSISGRHVTIYRKGKDLMLKNVGASPIAVNGLQVKPKDKQRLVIPSVVKLNDQTKLNLALLKAKATRSENASDQNGNK